MFLLTYKIKCAIIRKPCGTFFIHVGTGHAHLNFRIVDIFNIWKYHFKAFKEALKHFKYLFNIIPL